MTGLRTRHAALINGYLRIINTGVKRWTIAVDSHRGRSTRRVNLQWSKLRISHSGIHITVAAEVIYNKIPRAVVRDIAFVVTLICAIVGNDCVTQCEMGFRAVFLHENACVRSRALIAADRRAQHCERTVTRKDRTARVPSVLCSCASCDAPDHEIAGEGVVKNPNGAAVVEDGAAQTRATTATKEPVVGRN